MLAALHFLDLRLHLDYDGPQTIACNHELKKGEEMGWFEHGSTIIVLRAWVRSMFSQQPARPSSLARTELFSLRSGCKQRM